MENTSPTQNQQPSPNAHDTANPPVGDPGDTGAMPTPANDNGTGPIEPAPLGACRDDAERFIAALAGSRDARVTFQTFLDDKKNPPAGAPTPLVLHGSLADHWDTLVAVNRVGHGVFVMVNEGDLDGRSAQNVVGLRALFIDDDEGNLRYVGDGQAPFVRLPPSMTVETKRGHHNYFCLNPGEPLEQFTAAQGALARYFGTDPKVKDLPRVMRVPGFFHMKNPSDPFLVKLVQARDAKYTIAEVLAAYPSPEPSRPSGAPAGTDARDAGARERAVVRATKYVAKVPPAVQGDHGDEATFKLCSTLTRGFDLTDDEVMAVLAPWNERCRPPWADDDLLQKVRNARQHGSEEIGGRLDEPAAGDSPWKDFGDQKVLHYCVPVLDARFALHRAPEGTQRFFSVNANRETALVLDDNLLKQAVYKALKTRFNAIPPEPILARSVTLWTREAPPLTVEPEPFCFKGDDRLCFKRFDWEPEKAPYPAWEEFLARLSDPFSFMAFVWSCFEKGNESRQYVWLRGEGQDGKSKVLGVLADVFGPAATGISNSHATRGNQFFYSAIYGKRLVVYADCKNENFGMSEVVRNCTSGDPVMVEFKGETPFSQRMRIKLVIASNLKPKSSSQASDKSRLLYIEVAPAKNTDDPGWGRRLQEQLPGFLYDCRLAYRSQCPNGGDILVSDRTKALSQEAAASLEEEFAALFEDNFKVDPSGRVDAAIMVARLKSARLNNHQPGDFKAWMERTHGVKAARTNSKRFYTGISLRDVLAEARAMVVTPP